MARDERPVSAVPRPVVAALIFALALQIAWQARAPRPVARAEALLAPPPAAILRVASLGEPVPLAQLTTLYLQAFDNQPGISIPFRELDYPRVTQWLATILDLDPLGQYPLMMAAELYAQVPDPARTRMMFDFVYQQFLRDPDRRWRWLAHAAIAAKHRLKDPQLALHYAREIARRAPHALGWARQMYIFLLEDMGEVESAKVLLGALLASGEVHDPNEIRFLAERLKAMEDAEKSSPTPKN
jgi:hypothetical protein